MGQIVQTTDPQVADDRDRRFLADTPETLVYPMPPLGPGLHCDAPPPAGLPYPQLPIRSDDANGLSDTLLGPGFALVGPAAIVEPARERLARVGVAAAALVPAALADGAARAQFDAWLDAAGAPAVLVRPDRYVLGMLQDADDACRLLRDAALTK